MEAYALTDAGRVRSLNQDYIYFSSDHVGSLDNLFLLADGMGGHRAGDFASRFMIEHLNSYVERHKGNSPVRILQEGIRQVNWDLYRKSVENEALSGMGTTLVAATAEGDTLFVANVGDSRLYLFRGGRLCQVTRDHSYVEELVALGQMERNSRDYLEKKNIITRALGIMPDVEVDFFEKQLYPGDLILMCSDGLSNMLMEEEMVAILSQRDSLKKKVRRLVDRANEEGGYDNIALLADPRISEVRSC